MDNNTDMRCTKCNSEYVSKVPIELLSGVENLWYGLIIVSIFGVAVSPILIFLTIILIILAVIINLARKIKYRNYWVMQCNRCNSEFIVPNPDKIEIMQHQAELSEKRKQESIQVISKRIEKKKLATITNGRVNDDENLLDEFEYFGFHKNAFSNSGGSLKITDQAMICYNAKGSFRIPNSNIISVNKKNYFLFIPTGIQIKSRDKRKKYNFVVFPKERNEIINKINQII